MPAQPDLKPTPLADLHAELGAEMVEHAGFLLPEFYADVITEHRHARDAAVLFDVSHMGQAVLRGGDLSATVESLAPVDLRDAERGRSFYTVLTNDDGGIIDDVVVTFGGDHLFLVVNETRRDVVFPRIRAAIGSGGGLEETDDRAMLSLQGPDAGEVLARFAPALRHMTFMHGENLTVADAPCYVTRGGYTGEDGFELALAADDAERIARLLLAEPEVAPAGLGARDTLRLEAGHCLYGNDIDESTTPVEAGLAWVIGRRRRDEGGYPGAPVIARQLADGPPRRRVGLRLDGSDPAPPAGDISVPGGDVIGRITSAAFSPTIGVPIATGYVTAQHATDGTAVTIGDAARPARVTALPFVQHKYKR